MSTTASEPLVLPLPPLDKHCSYNPCPTFGESDGEAKHRCSLCKGVSYCGQRCQKLDWKENHRWNCSPLAIDNDKAFLEPDPEELEELTRVIMHWKEAYDKLPDAEKQKQNKGWKASSMPESKGLLDLQIASGASYSRLPKNHTKYPFRLPIILITRRFLSSMFHPPLPPALERIPDMLCRMGREIVAPNYYPRMHGPKIIRKPADLSSGEYGTILDWMPVALLEHGIKGEVKEWGDRWIALATAEKLLWTDDGVATL
ncbi:hypothetical protein CC1G_04617 [Coprinopsis cinerea okayama7|uniref:MYND-type domain-containing protein n=1 Tax=Coprinopsis cinerea (strain Okayama-7 / 130 / ATCC MYA-4618 / FGSC 9003) TaxID=240176 RepID=A8N4V7_COPC7|nr:hypothetical protein CC1G_04617 [Coprinopsis cinerea okayama7\|eukprot:XP_001829928.1 hypothetical protein CC1G_04617 [Coprinopsis cinerea okayama7\